MSTGNHFAALGRSISRVGAALHIVAIDVYPISRIAECQFGGFGQGRNGRRGLMEGLTIYKRTLLALRSQSAQRRCKSSCIGFCPMARRLVGRDSRMLGEALHVTETPLLK